MEEDDHAAEKFVCVSYVGVWEAIWMRGLVGVAYDRQVEIEASLDEGLVENEIRGGKGKQGEDEEGKQNILE